jgi:hypothetical protein
MALPPSRAQVERRLAKVEASEGGGEPTLVVVPCEELESLDLVPYGDDVILIVTGVPLPDPHAVTRIWEDAGEPPITFSAHDEEIIRAPDGDVVNHSLNVNVRWRKRWE